MNVTGSTAALAGRHAVVTGAARGIGFAIACELRARGATVTLLGRDAAALAAACAKLDAGHADGGQAGYEVADVCHESAMQAAYARLAERAGPATILVNNAGSAESAPFARTDAALWQRMLEVNLTGTYHGIRAALPAMRAAGSGRIVNVASTAGQVGYPYVAAYCAAKHGVIGLTRALALELAGEAITVNAVCPGYTDTAIVQASIANIVAKTGRSADAALASLVAHNPQRRLVRPEEVADAVLWLCLPGSASITGQSISVSGGEVT